MQKKLVQSSLALTAAAALGLGSAFVAAPAAADGPEKVLTEQQAVSAAKSVSHVNAFGFDEKTKTLHLGVDDDEAADSDEIDGLKKKYGADKVEVVTGIQAAEPYAKNDAVGGMGYLSDIPSRPGYIGVCSTGFAGWNSNGDQVVLTAGHCAEDGSPGNTVKLKDAELPSTAPAVTGDHEEGGYDPQNIGPLGEWGYNKFGGPVTDEKNPEEAQADDIDFAAINVSDSYNVKPEVTDWTSAESNDLSASTSPVTKVGSHSAGEVKKSGRTTGLTTGEVAGPEAWPFDYQNVGDRWVHGFGVISPVGEDFSMQGDSGGGVFQGETAVGVISGGIPTPVEIDGKEVMWGWVADLDYSLEQSKVDFQLTNPNEEPPGDDEANADAAAEGDNADDAADGNEAEADADAAAEGDNADADAGAEGDDANADDAADGNEAEADADAAAEGDDANASTDAEGKDDDADGSDDGEEPTVPGAPKVGDQTVEEGGNITGKAAANADVKLTWKAAGDAQAGSAKAQADVPAEGNVTVKADADGNFTAEAPAEAGEYAYTATATVDGETSEATSFTVTVEASDDAPAERKLTVDPKEVTASDFVKKDKGVQIKAEGFEEGEKVTLEVTSGPENVEGITLDETANEDGVAGFSIYGTSASDPSAYLGKYDVQVTGANDTADEEALNGSFEVVSDEDGNGGGSDGDDDGNNGDDDGNGDGGSDLPRTGAELTGLAAGAGLLLVGGAAVVLTLRRNKQN